MSRVRLGRRILCDLWPPTTRAPSAPEISRPMLMTAPQRMATMHDCDDGTRPACQHRLGVGRPLRARGTHGPVSTR